MAKVHALYQDEKRSSIRFPLHLPVTVGQDLKGTTVNIPSDGLLLKTARPLAVGKESEVTIMHPVKKDFVKTIGRIIRVSTVNTLHLSALYFSENIGCLIPRRFKNIVIPA